MRSVYEVTCRGFFGGDDVTDHLVVWVEASTAGQVKDAMSGTGADFCGRIGRPDDFASDIDFQLPDQDAEFARYLVDQGI